MSREEKITQTFVELADTLVDDFDVIDFLQQLTVRCCDILAVTDTAVLLAYPGPHLYSPAPCDPSPALPKVLDPALREGPGLDAYRTATTVAPGHLARAPAAWHDFTTQAIETGYTYASAVPMRLRRESLGSRHPFARRAALPHPHRTGQGRPRRPPRPLPLRGLHRHAPPRPLPPSAADHRRSAHRRPRRPPPATTQSPPPPPSEYEHP